MYVDQRCVNYASNVHVPTLVSSWASGDEYQVPLRFRSPASPLLWPVHSIEPVEPIESAASTHAAHHHHVAPHPHALHPVHSEPIAAPPEPVPAPGRCSHDAVVLDEAGAQQLRVRALDARSLARSNRTAKGSAVTTRSSSVRGDAQALSHSVAANSSRATVVRRRCEVKRQKCALNANGGAQTERAKRRPILTLRYSAPAASALA